MRKLAKQCDRITRNVPAVNLLRQHLHPIKGTQLTIPARRVVKADVGYQPTLCDELPNRQRSDLACTFEDPCAVSADCVDVVAHPPPFFFEAGGP